VNPQSRPGFSSYEGLEDKIRDELAAYKAEVDKMNLYPSDRKKLLSLPFYLAKRQEDPEPRFGSTDIELFKELTGRGWFENSKIVTDPEHKITEFDYEKYLNPTLLKDVDTQSDEFKTLIKQLNFNSRTRYEDLEEKKSNFRKLMPMLAGLTE